MLKLALLPQLEYKEFQKMAMHWNRIPDGWLDYSNFNKCIDQTRILAVKTPLKEMYNTGMSVEELARRDINSVPLGQEFTPANLVQDLADKDLILGLVIDLTNTNRYYDRQEFMSANVSYEKLKCVGREIPSDDIYERFSKILNSFLSKNKTAIVAVHCTHGLNRTGYLVCRYLVECLSYNVEDAITAFESARGYKIERVNYLDHLRNGCPKLPDSTHTSSFALAHERLYHSGTSDSPKTPPRYKWDNRDYQGRRDYSSTHNREQHWRRSSPDRKHQWWRSSPDRDQHWRRLSPDRENWRRPSPNKEQRSSSPNGEQTLSPDRKHQQRSSRRSSPYRDQHWWRLSPDRNQQRRSSRYYHTADCEASDSDCSQKSPRHYQHTTEAKKVSNGSPGDTHRRTTIGTDPHTTKTHPHITSGTYCHTTNGTRSHTAIKTRTTTTMTHSRATTRTHSQDTIWTHSHTTTNKAQPYTTIGTQTGNTTRTQSSIQTRSHTAAIKTDSKTQLYHHSTRGKHSSSSSPHKQPSKRSQLK